MPKRSNSRHPSTSSRCLTTRGTRAALGATFVLEAFLGLVACQGGTPASECAVGSERCACTSGGACDPGLECRSGLCVTGGDVKASGEASGATSAGATTGSAAGSTGVTPATTATPAAEPAPSAPTPAPAPDTTVANSKPSYLVWSKTGGEGCEATYRTRWVREGSNGEVEELGAVDKLVLSAGNDAYEIVTQCELHEQMVDCVKELGADVAEAIEAPRTDTYEKTFIHLGLRSVSSGSTVNPVSGRKYLTLKQPITQAKYEEATPLKSYADTVIGSAGNTLFVASRTRDFGDACGMQGNGFTDESVALLATIGGADPATRPKVKDIPAAIKPKADEEARRACLDCVKSVVDEPGDGECTSETAERVSSVSPLFTNGELTARWALLVPVPVGVCRETDDHMYIYVESDTLPPEWNVSKTPAIVKKAMAALTPTTITKPKSPTPMGWTEVTQEASAAGHVAKALGK